MSRRLLPLRAGLPCGWVGISGILTPLRCFSMSLPQSDLLDKEPATIPVVPPVYVLFPIDSDVPMSSRRFGTAGFCTN